jgi:hypothetical protein
VFALVPEGAASASDSVGRVYVYTTRPSRRFYVSVALSCGMLFATDNGFLADANGPVVRRMGAGCACT